jgi:hypothetical protein
MKWKSHLFLAILVVAMSSFCLTTLKSQLTITTDPSGALIYIDGVYRGTSPLTLELDPGTYTVGVEKPNYKTAYETVTLNPGESRSILVKLDLLKAKLSVYTDPSGALIYIDGVYRGTSPLTLELDPGTYTVRVEKPNYKTAYKTVELNPGENRSILVKLELVYEAALAKDYASKIDYTNPVVRNLAVQLASKYPGERNIMQVQAIYEYVYNKWKYVSDPKGKE